MSSIRQAYRKHSANAKPVMVTLITLWLSTVLWACGSEREAGFDHAVLWRIEKAGSAPSYILGTIHSDDPRVLKLPTQVTTNFDGCRLFAMEVKLDAQAAAQMSHAMSYEDGSHLSQHIPHDLYRETVAAMKNNGMPESAAESLRPWAIAMVLSQPKPKSEDGRFLDLVLMHRAMQEGKPVETLETIDEQIAVLSGFSPKEQERLLEETLHEIGDIPGIQDEMLKAYLARDLSGLTRISQREMDIGDSPELSRKFWARLITERNRHMAERMRSMLEQGNACVAVGALHLAGREGVLNLLAQQGYKPVAVF